jgi:hypothetical protein
VRLASVAAIGLAGVCMLACGEAGSGSASPEGYLIGDYDVDDHGGSDYDDGKIRTYGREASSGERHAVAGLVKLYYAAAATNDGVHACSLVDSRLAKSSNFAKVVPEGYEPAAGSTVFRGKSCAQVASLLFELTHQQLVSAAATVRVTGLRVDGTHGLAILIFTKTPESEIPVEHEHGAWKIGGFLGSPLP